MNAAEYRQHKDDLIKREIAARERAQLAQVAVAEAKVRGDQTSLPGALEAYQRAVEELEDLEHQTGEF